MSKIEQCFIVGHTQIHGLPRPATLYTHTHAHFTNLLQFDFNFLLLSPAIEIPFKFNREIKNRQFKPILHMPRTRAAKRFCYN